MNNSKSEVSNLLTKKIKPLIIILTIITICPFFIACFFCGPSIDDTEIIAYFKQYNDIKILFPFKLMIYYFMNWQGSFFSCLLLSIPFFNIGGIWCYRILMIMIISFFFYSFASSFMCLTDLSNKRSLAHYILFFLVLLYLIGTNTLGELFYWFNSSCVYTIPTSCSFLAIACLLRYNKTPQKRFIMSGILFAFFAGGGALNVSAFCCASILLLLYLNHLNAKPINSTIFIFVSAFLGTLINIFAPGNFVRKEIYSPQASLIVSTINSFYRVNTVILSQLQIGFLGIILALIFFISYKHFSVVPSLSKKSHPFLISIYCYLCVVAIDAPVIYGYGSPDLMSERTIFIETISLLFFSGIASAVWGEYIASHHILNFTKEQIFILLFICILPLSFYIDFHNLEELTPYKMILHMVGSENDFAANARKQEDIIRQIISSDSENVIVHTYKDSSETWYNTREIGLNEDPSYWVNHNVAVYFEKKSITVVYDN